MSKPSQCAGCVYVDSGVGFVPDLSSKLLPRFEFVGDRPWKTELAFQQPFAGQAGFVLKQWGISVVPEVKLAFDRGEVTFSNTLRCLPVSLEQSQRTQRSKEHHAAASHCRVHDGVPGRVRVLLGEVPQRFFFAKELAAEDALDRARGAELKGVMGRIGRVYVKDSVKYVFAPHPSAVLRSPRLVTHLQRALQIAASDAPLITPQCVSLASHYAVPLLGFDMEWSRDKISVIGFASEIGVTAVQRDESTWRAMQNILNDATEVVIHNGHAADLRQMAKEGVDVENLEARVFDTMLAAHSVWPHLAGSGSYDIRSVVLLVGAQGGRHFPLDWKDYSGDIFKTCREDAAAALWVSAPLKRLIKAHGLERTVALSHAIAPMFARMTERGVQMDTSILERIHHERKEKVAEIIAKYGLTEQRGVKKVRSVPIWRSSKLLDKFELLFKLRPPDRQRKTWERLANNPSLSSDARDFAFALVDLTKGANDAHWLGDANEDEDTQEVTFDKLDQDGRIHPRYRIDGSPDRPIARGPNIQNFPRPGDDPRSTPLRASVIPFESNEVLVSVDFGSIETYTNAIAADDWDMVRDIQAGVRSHEQAAADCSRIVGRTLTRFEGKTINHARDKGESPSAMAQRLFGVTRASREQKAKCVAIYDAFLTKYPKTSAFRDRLWKESESNPMVVKDAFGRRLECFARSRYGDSGDGGWAPRHDAKLKYWCPCKACAPRRERWKAALAFVGRAPAVTALLWAMHRIWSEKRLDAYSLPVAEIHDELLFSLDRNKVLDYTARIVDTFREPVPELGDISLPVEAKSGTNWSQCK